MKSEVNDISMAEAAQILGVGRNTLFKQLRALKVLSDRNLPRGDLIRAGLFRIEHRAYTKPSDRFRIQQHYGVTLVTEKGLNYLQELIDQEEKRNGNSRTAEHTDFQTRRSGTC
jgi:phage antirepressor YoqD-like protein